MDVERTYVSLYDLKPNLMFTGAISEHSNTLHTDIVVRIWLFRLKIQKCLFLYRDF